MMIVHVNHQLYNAFRGLGIGFHSHSESSICSHFCFIHEKPSCLPSCISLILDHSFISGFVLLLFPSVLKMVESLFPASEGHTESFWFYENRDNKRDPIQICSYKHMVFIRIQSWVLTVSSHSCQMINYLKIKSSAFAEKEIHIPMTPIPISSKYWREQINMHMKHMLGIAATFL